MGTVTQAGMEHLVAHNLQEMVLAETFMTIIIQCRSLNRISYNKYWMPTASYQMRGTDFNSGLTIFCPIPSTRRDDKGLPRINVDFTFSWMAKRNFPCTLIPTDYRSATIYGNCDSGLDGTFGGS
ncbi:hypothetical protein CEXT_119521 [Caerostris extrusa]|uniref:Uncharacterized protein n=1 Tax=Caerostris extrusa TaxID=172846 RepID=A0AAV4VVZ9_CAEEX|nr:hypothetical protein CEXT_119521 [Caerostris extrusa]